MKTTVNGYVLTDNEGLCLAFDQDSTGLLVYSVTDVEDASVFSNIESVYKIMEFIDTKDADKPANILEIKKEITLGKAIKMDKKKEQ